MLFENSIVLMLNFNSHSKFQYIILQFDLCNLTRYDFFIITERLEYNDSSFEKAKKCSSRIKLLSELQRSTILRSEE